MLLRKGCLGQRHAWGFTSKETDLPERRTISLLHLESEVSLKESLVGEVGEHNSPLNNQSIPPDLRRKYSQQPDTTNIKH